MQLPSFFGTTRSELQRSLKERGARPVHADALFRHFFKHGALTPLGAPGLGPRLIAAQEQEYTYEQPQIGVAHESAYDHSVKFRMDLGDGAQVETVLMPESRRITVCLSTQVGCAQACTFCHTGRMGLVRNLSPAEIVGQIVVARAWIAANPEWIQRVRLPAESSITNVVFMGMGEPLDNCGPLATALEIMCDPYGLNLSLRKISVSTAGHIDGLRQIVARFPDVNLALSLHATTDQARSRIMPINRRWPLAELMSFFRQHYKSVGAARHLLIQYTVISGVNDAEEDATRLVALLAELPVKVNLIPLNEISVSRLKAPEPGRVEAFRDQLHQAGLRVMVRYSKGQDIAAGCGQLVLKV